jgi:hypothetical protein
LILKKWHNLLKNIDFFQAHFLLKTTSFFNKDNNSKSDDPLFQRNKRTLRPNIPIRRSLRSRRAESEEGSPPNPSPRQSTHLATSVANGNTSS